MSDPADDAFYDRGGPNVFVPTAATIGPWDPNLQHGSPPASLLAWAMTSTSPRPDMRLAFFSMDFFGPVPRAPMTVAAEVVRGGKKIELLSATASIGGRVALRASGWRVAVEEGRTPEKNLADPPSPPLPPAGDVALFTGVPRFGYADALEWRFVEGGFAELGPATVWSRLRVAVVRGEEVTPLSRALAMVDSANGISMEVEAREFLAVPVNLTVSMTVTPRGEWVGMSARTAMSRDGAGTTRARVFDREGGIGEAVQTLFVARR